MPEQTVLSVNAHVKNAADEGQMDSNKTAPLRGADPAGSLGVSRRDLN